MPSHLEAFSLSREVEFLKIFLASGMQEERRTLIVAERCRFGIKGQYETFLARLVGVPAVWGKPIMRDTIQTGVALAVGIAQLATAELIPERFVSPPDDSRPMTWMHMMNGNASKEGMEKDLRSLRDAGVGGALIFSISYHGIPAGNTDFNSQKFRNVINHGAKVADEIGLKVGLHNCDGWSSSGGPWITVEESMKHLVWNETVVQGGGVETRLPRPEVRYDFYRDVALVAIPANQSEFEAARNGVKVTSSSGPSESKKLFDGDLSNGINLRFGKGQKDPWIQFEYERPFPAQSLRVAGSSRDGGCQLWSSQDGKKFDLVTDLKSQTRPGKRVFGFEGGFPAIDARFYKLKFTSPRGRGMVIHEVDLTAFPRRAGWLYEGGRTKSNGVMDRAMAAADYQPADFSPMDRVIVLPKGDLSKDVLRTQLPEGIWRVMRFGFTTTGTKNHPPTAAGLGFECDKLDAAVLDKHFAAYMGKVIEEAGPLAGKSLLYSEIDSYEMGWQNWTDDFLTLFQERRGYDLTPFLPLIAGRFIGDADAANAVSNDFRAVITDLMTQNYFERFTELCNENGLLSYIEPYGNGPLNNLEVGGRCDIPMGEFWMSKTTIVRSAIHAAHVYGKPVISAESFTSWADLNWKGHPYLMKEYGDNAWAEGINEFMFHRFAHQANIHVAPGMTMGSVGSHLDRTQTWWLNAGKAWNEYNQRGSYLLRQGVPVSDVLAYIGDQQPSSDAGDFTIGLPGGYNLDSCGAEVLRERITVQNGRLILPEGTSYAVLMLTGCEQLHLASLQRLQELAEAGATIIGEMPEEPISYLERQNKREEFTALAKELWGDGKAPNRVGKGQVITSVKFPSDPSTLGLEADLLIQGQAKPKFMHRKVGNDDFYFVHHRGKAATTLECSFRVSGRIPELWYADTGKMEKQAQFTEKDGRTHLAIDLDPSGSVFVVFREASEGFDPVVSVTPESGRVIINEDKELQLLATAEGDYTLSRASGATLKASVGNVGQPIDLSRAWRVQFVGPGLEGEQFVNFGKLSDWKDHQRDDIRHFSGTAAYRKRLEVPEAWLAGEKLVYLDLGEVSIAAEVILNGKNVGILWKPPFVIDVSDAVVAGTNELEIKVTNQWTNRLIGDQSLEDTSGYYRGNKPGRKMPDWYVNNEPMPEGPRSTFTTWNFYEKDRELLPAGMHGPVMLKGVAISKMGKN